MKLQWAIVFLSAGFMLLAVVASGRDSVGAASGPGLEKATFAGGCFWCMEPPFDKLPGVKSVISGYTGGQKLNPTYEEVSAGTTGHAESIEITYDPAVVSYSKLLDVFWHNIDPTVKDRQFCDVGLPVPIGDLLSRRGAEAACRGIEKGARAVEALRRPHPHRDRRRDNVLPRRGVSSEILSEESDPV